MKFLMSLVLLTFSASALACPNIAGSFYDSDEEVVKTITQAGCASTTWSDGESVTTLLADNTERVLETNGKITAFAKVSFTSDDLIIDIRMDWGGNNEFDLPVRWITSYRIDKFGHLVEKIRPFKEDGSEQGTEYVTFRRIK